jgi:hypothetical protein
MDTRTLVDHFNLLASIVQSNHMELQRQRHILNDLQQAFNVESKITSAFIVERLFNMERSLRRLVILASACVCFNVNGSGNGAEPLVVNLRLLSQNKTNHAKVEPEPQRVGAQCLELP